MNSFLLPNKYLALQLGRNRAKEIRECMVREGILRHGKFISSSDATRAGKEVQGNASLVPTVTALRSGSDRKLFTQTLPSSHLCISKRASASDVASVSEDLSKTVRNEDIVEVRVHQGDWG